MKKVVLVITMAVLLAAGSLELASAAGGPGRGNNGRHRNWACPASDQSNSPCPRNHWGAGRGQGRHANPNCPYRTR
jgi:hypothetical protein